MIEPNFGGLGSSTRFGHQLSEYKKKGTINPQEFGTLLFDQTRLTQACADSGCTTTICIPETPMKNVRPTRKPIRLKNASGGWLETTHEGEIDIPGLPAAARKAHICPKLAHTSLISIKTLVDAGCTVTFNKHKCIVQYEGKTVWRGQGEDSTGLWILPLNPEGPEEIEQLKISPQQWMSTVEQLNQERQANNV